MRDDKVTDLETLFSMRLSSERVRFWRDLITLFLICSAFFFGLACFGGLQYYICTVSNPDVIMSECFRLQGRQRR